MADSERAARQRKIIMLCLAEGCGPAAIARLLSVDLAVVQSVVASHGLTERQLQVYLLAAQGYCLKEIACRLDISCKTADAHKNAVYKRFGIHTQSALTIHALRTGFITLDDLPAG